MALFNTNFVQLMLYVLGIIGLFLILYYIAIAGSEEDIE